MKINILEEAACLLPSFWIWLFIMSFVILNIALYGN